MFKRDVPNRWRFGWAWRLFPGASPGSTSTARAGWPDLGYTVPLFVLANAGCAHFQRIETRVRMPSLASVKHDAERDRLGETGAKYEFSR